MTPHIPLQTEQLANFSLNTTGELCPDTMLAHFSALNPNATDKQVEHARTAFVEFVEDAS